ncbi:MAG: hypothetical protein ACE5KT_08670 [Methanosarcinales archaeon]
MKKEEYECVALSAGCLLLSIDHLVDAYLSYLGKWHVGRTERYNRFRKEVLVQDVYILQEYDRNFISHTINRVAMWRNRLLYARDDILYDSRNAKIEIGRLINDVRRCRTIIKEQVL